MTYWQNMIYTGRISFLPAEYDFHWQNMICTGWLSLLLVEYDLYWQNMTSIGRIRFILAYCHSYWQNMQPIKSVLPFCSALPIQYTPNANTVTVQRPQKTTMPRPARHLTDSAHCDSWLLCTIQVLLLFSSLQKPASIICKMFSFRSDCRNTHPFNGPFSGTTWVSHQENTYHVVSHYRKWILR